MIHSGNVAEQGLHTYQKVEDWPAEKNIIKYIIKNYTCFIFYDFIESKIHLK